MAVDRARVVMVFASGPTGGQNGSGYAIGERLVLTAAHVLSQAGLVIDSEADVCLLGSTSWVSALVVWLDSDLDAALLRVDAAARWPALAMSVLRWGELAGNEPVLAAAIGFPWSQQRPDGIHDTEHAVGFVPPGTGTQTGSLHVSVVSSAPLPRPDGKSPWAGMSGAGLVVGPYLVGIVVVDPARYGTDRLVVVPVARLLADPTFATALGDPVEVTQVGARWRLEYATGRSVTLAPPYRPLPRGLNVTAVRQQLLFPGYNVVPFAGREHLVEALADWCTERDAPGLEVRTITGGGGSGKTRLAAQVCLRVAGAGFDAGFADATSPGGAVRWLLDRPTLLVVDNADLNLTLVAGLVSALAYTDVPVRLLLVARSRTPWWQSLQTMPITQYLIDGFDRGDLPLTEHTLDLPARMQQYQAALNALTAMLPDASGSHSAIPDPPDLTAMAFADPLMVHLAALLAASGEPFDATQGPSGTVRTRVMRAFLDLEAARWPTQIAAEEPAQIAPVVLRRCVGAATITAPRDESSGAATLVAVPDLATDSEIGRRHALARWLHTLNAGSDYWNPLRPDPLADRLLADLDALPELAVTVTQQAIQQTDRATLDRLLAELTRAAAANGGAAAVALNRIYDQLGELLDAALTQPDGPLPQRLNAALEQVPAPAAAAKLVGRLPGPSLAIADLAETLTGQSVMHYRQLTADDPAAQNPNLAWSLNDHSTRLAVLGRFEDALEASTEAVAIDRKLAEAQPDLFRPDLANSLNTQSSELAGLGRLEDALTTVNEAVAIYRELAADRPDAFYPNLAEALSNKGNVLAGLGRLEDALAAATEAVEIYRELAATHPDTFNADLARSLNNRSPALAVLGLREDALAAATEAVEIYRELATTHPDTFNADLAWSLNKQSIRSAQLGLREDALAAATEAVEIYRELAAANSDVMDDLAGSLNNQSIALAALGLHEDALAAIIQAVEIYRALAATRPDMFYPGLAMSLNTLYTKLADLGQHEDALPAITQAVEIYRALATARPQAFYPDLAKSLNNQANALAALDRSREAADAFADAIDIYRELAPGDPEALYPELAQALTILGMKRSELSDFDAALSADREAVSIYRALYSINPGRYRDPLRHALKNFRIDLRDLGRTEDEIAGELDRLQATGNMRSMVLRRTSPNRK